MYLYLNNNNNNNGGGPLMDDNDYLKFLTWSSSFSSFCKFLMAYA